MLDPLAAVARYGSQNKAADQLGMGRTKFRELHKLAAFQQNGADCHQPVATEQPEPLIAPKPVKPRLSVKGDGSAYRILAVGDLHDKPGLDKTRFKWIARHAQATKPDKIVQIGDMADLASCSGHEKPGTISYSLKPSFRQDMESLEEALTLVYKEISSDIPLLQTEGNHEDRAARWEETHPEVEGGFYSQLQEMFARFGWKSYRYGTYLFIGGVAFTHVPMTTMCKPFGGEQSENTIGNKSTFSLVWGHTHRPVFKQVPKILGGIDLLNLGSAMPQGYLPAYCKNGLTGWGYGVFDLEIREGRITAHTFVPMTKLEALYGD